MFGKTKFEVVTYDNGNISVEPVPFFRAPAWVRNLKPVPYSPLRLVVAASVYFGTLYFLTGDVVWMLEDTMTTFGLSFMAVLLVLFSRSIF